MNRETPIRTTARPETRGRNFYRADPSLRACRDARKVIGDGIEAPGGCGHGE